MHQRVETPQHESHAESACSEGTAVRFAKGRKGKGILGFEVAPLEAHEALTDLLSDSGCWWCVAKTPGGLESRAVVRGETVAVSLGGETATEAAELLLSALLERPEFT